MLRNWVTQFGYASGKWAGDEGVSEEDRRKFIGQIGNYFGWNPPTMMNWMVEVAKDNEGKYVMVFMRYATEDEAEKMLGKNYEKLEAERRDRLGLPEFVHENPYPNGTENIQKLGDDACAINEQGYSACLPFDTKKTSTTQEVQQRVTRDIGHFNTAFGANAHRL